jgi:hypothetical protein
MWRAKLGGWPANRDIPLVVTKETLSILTPLSLLGLTFYAEVLRSEKLRQRGLCGVLNRKLQASSGFEIDSVSSAPYKDPYHRVTRSRAWLPLGVHPQNLRDARRPRKGLGFHM